MVESWLNDAAQTGDGAKTVRTACESVGTVYEFVGKYVVSRSVTTTLLEFCIFTPSSCAI